jgi:hypothetical protein
LADAAVARKREESIALMAILLGQQAGETLNLPEDNLLRAASHFVVGGVTQAISAWLAGHVVLTTVELVDQLAWSLDRLNPLRS